MFSIPFSLRPAAAVMIVAVLLFPWRFGGAQSSSACSSPLCTVSAAHVTDAGGNPLNGTIVFVPTDMSGVQIPFHVPGLGQGVPVQTSAPVTAGTFSLSLADSTQTSPANLCYRTYITDRAGRVISGSNTYNPNAPLQCVQMNPTWCAGNTCSFDNYAPGPPVLTQYAATPNKLGGVIVASAGGLTVDNSGNLAVSPPATGALWTGCSTANPLMTYTGVCTVAAGGVNADWNATSGLAQILNKPVIPAAQVNSDWNASSGLAQILNKPTIPAAQVQSDWNATSGLGVILNKPSLLVLGTTANTALPGNTFIPPAQVNSDWSATSGLAQILNKPTIPAAQVQSDWNATSGLGVILNKPSLLVLGNTATTALPGNTYIPPGQVNSDWSASSGLAQILNKPTIPAAQVQSDWNATTGLGVILNKPALGTAAYVATSAFDASGTAAAAQAAAIAASLQKANNLSELLSAATARTNLGLGSAATQNSTAFDAAGTAATAQAAAIAASDPAGSAATAQAAAIAASLQKANNLSDLTNASTARTNLGLGTAATTASTAYDAAGAAAAAVAALPTATNAAKGLLASTDWTAFNAKQAALGYTPLNPSNNLSDVPVMATARTNLGLGTAATQPMTAFDASGAASSAAAGVLSTSMQKLQNLADLNNTTTARSNLGLGSAAVQNAITVSVKDPAYGATGNGTTDDSAAVLPAVNAACQSQAGNVNIPAGTYLVSGNIPLYNNCRIQGAGFASTTIKLKNGANADVFDGTVNGYSGAMVNYAAANHTGSTTGIHGWSINDLTIDGNNANQTAASCGIKQYGYNFKIHNVNIQNTYSDGIYSDFNAVDPNTPAGSIEADVVNLKVYHAGMDQTNTTMYGVGSVGIRWGGPTDSHFTNVITYQNASHGLMVGPNGGAMQIATIHAWGSHIGNRSVGILIEGGTTTCVNCEAEGSDTAQIALLAGENVINARVFQPTTEAQSSNGIVLGQAAGGLAFAGAFYQATPGNLTPGSTDSVAASSNGNVIVARIYNTYLAGIAFVNENVNNILATVNLSTTGTGSYASGTPGVNDTYQIAGTGLTCSGGTLATCGGNRFFTGGGNALTVNNGSLDYLNFNNAAHVLQLVNGSGMQLFSDSYSTKTYSMDNSNGVSYNAGQTSLKVPHAGEWALNGAIAFTGQAAQTVFNNGTILRFASSQDWEQLPVVATAALTGLILQAGDQDGEQVSVINESAYTMTFAAAATSNVADGTSDVLSALSVGTYRWVSAKSLWYRVTGVPGASSGIAVTGDLLMGNNSGGAIDSTLSSANIAYPIFNSNSYGNGSTNGIQSAVAACGTSVSCSVLAAPTYGSTETSPCPLNNVGSYSSTTGCGYTMASNVVFEDNRYGIRYRLNVDGGPYGAAAAPNYKAFDRVDRIDTTSAAGTIFENRVARLTTEFGLSGGVNVSNGNYVANLWPNKAFYIGNDTRVQGYAAGQKIGNQSFVNSYGVGDALGYYAINTCYGGFSAGSDEGCEAMDIQATEGTVQFTGSVTGVTSNTVAITVSAGDGTQGEGRFLIDTQPSVTISAGTISAIGSPANSSTPLVVTGSGTGWPVSTAMTTATTATNGGSNATITVSSATGITTSTNVCIADPYYMEQATPSAVNSGTGVITFANLRYPHTVGAYLSVGGLACRFLRILADDATNTRFPSLAYTLQNPLWYIIPIVNSTSATTLNLWLESPNNGFAGYRGKWSATANTYAIYPGAQVTSVMQSQKLSSTLTVETAAAFTAGDAVVQPLYHNLNVYAALHSVQRTTPQIGGANAAAWWLQLSGLWTDFDTAFQITNATPLTEYATAYGGSGGSKGPPIFMHPAGLWDKVLYFSTGDVAPNTIIDLTGPNSVTPAKTTDIVDQQNASGKSYFMSDAGNHRWMFANYFNGNYLYIDSISGNLQTTGKVYAGGYVTSLIETGLTTNNDLAGKLTMSGGTQTYSFTGGYVNAPICTANDTTAIAAVRVQTSNTTLTVSTTGSSDVVNYTCIASY